MTSNAIEITKSKNSFDEVKKYENLIEVNTKAIQNLRNANIDQCYALSTITKLKKQNLEYEEKKLGLLLNIPTTETQDKETCKKIKFTIGATTTEPKKSEEILEKNSSSVGIEDEKEYMSDTISETMCNKLTRVSGGMGYAWRGINFFYLNKYPSSNKIILYERQNGVIQPKKAPKIKF